MRSLRQTGSIPPATGAGNCVKCISLWRSHMKPVIFTKLRKARRPTVPVDHKGTVSWATTKTFQ
jgi:hypothetical protein